MWLLLDGPHSVELQPGKAHALGYERGRRRRTVTFRFPFFFLKSSILGDSI